MEYYWFAHFGPNTFTGAEWGTGREKARVFNPSGFDARQWCKVAKAAGAKGIIITAKHHDGFCLWPSRFSTHTVRESSWKNGQGDVLKELSTACKEFGLKFGVYLSPWDRNHPDYGTPRYNQVFALMLREIFQNYGPIWELWWDGANGEGPNGKRQEYDWELFRKTVRQLSPSTVIFSDVGPDIRWVGNEKGIAGKTNWNLLNIEGFAPGEAGPSTDTLTTGNKYGSHWIPAECDVSIRPGWFWRASEDTRVKKPEELFQLYLKSVGRGANLLLNVPPDSRGLIAAPDSASLVGFAALREKNFSHNLIRRSKVSLLIDNKKIAARRLQDGSALSSEELPNPCQQVLIKLLWSTKLNCISLQEEISQGQSCSQFTVSLFNKKGKLIKTLEGTTIGAKRILTFPTCKVNSIVFQVKEQKRPVRLAEISLFKLDENLLEK